MEACFHLQVKTKRGRKIKFKVKIKPNPFHEKSVHLAAIFATILGIQDQVVSK